MVLDTVIYHPTLTKFISLLNKTAGREKILRLLQYLVRFLAVQYSSGLNRQLQSEFTIVRKILRFFKPLNHIQDAAKLYDNKIAPDHWVRWLSVIKNVGYIGYLSLDQVNLLRILKLVPSTPITAKKVPRYTNWFWFAALVAGLITDFRNLYTSQRKIEASLTLEGNAPTEKASSEKLNAFYNQRFAAFRRLVWDSVDTFIVLNNLQFLRNDESSVALAGVATSVFGLQDLWKAT
ncbi:unnamed protein product [Kluyveromyces dobzhanskii CBS 2104]|uniref:WGS project CCBQ000000000 data, contig 00106 n=1 Tax=Kluyveromyces dobzhanskii CBS 2104 TaxID=1427455 RepID=A0A0A8L551_9SACH|nr:unnamed protein product [Kluyveromyces dobzhanskii CBS 2104]